MIIDYNGPLEFDFAAEMATLEGFRADPYAPKSAIRAQYLLLADMMKRRACAAAACVAGAALDEDEESEAQWIDVVRASVAAYRAFLAKAARLEA